VVNIVFFQQGILGWAKEKWPERFGIRVEQKRGEQEPWSGEKAA
jgi:branched-chain amino acid transport system permease protein